MRSGFCRLPGCGDFGGTTAGVGWSRSRSCAIAQREPLPAVPDALPEAEPLAVPEAPVPELEPVEPAPVSVLTVPLTDPVAVSVVEGTVETVVFEVLVSGVLEVGVVVLVTVEPGVALAPELLFAVFAPLLQPARPAVASAAAAM
jgi:hypothetical protein